MTKIEAVKDYQYDISIFYQDDNLWYWDINGGYSSVGSHNGYFSPQEAEESLDIFLQSFKGFDK